MLNLPSFHTLEDWELCRTVADLQFQLGVAQSFLDRAVQEIEHRKKEKREGVHRMPDIVIVKTDPKPH